MMRKADLTRLLSVATIAGTVVTVTGCSSGSGVDHTFVGQPVVDLETGLERVELAWRQDVSNSATKIRLADDARCYFQVDAHEVDGTTPLGNSVLCGPYREMGGTTTAWDLAAITAYPFDETGDLAIVLAPGEPDEIFQEGSTGPNQVPWRPDGLEPDLTQEVPEPDAPIIEAGTVLEASPPRDLVEPLGALRTPFAAFTVGRGVAARVDTADGRVAAPEGGTFVIYSVRGAVGMGEDQPLPTFRVVLGDEGYELPGTSGVWAVSVPGDGGDASLEMDFEGVPQTLDAQGTRSASATAEMLYDEAGQPPAVGPLEDEQGGHRTEGWSGTVGTGWSTPKARVTPYAEGFGWAPEGQAWLVVEGKVSPSGIKYHDGDGDATGYYNSQKVEITGIEIDEEAVASPNLESGEDSATFTIAHPVDPTMEEVRITISAHVTALRAGWADDSLPERGEMDFILEAPILR